MPRWHRMFMTESFAYCQRDMHFPFLMAFE